MKGAKESGDDKELDQAGKLGKIDVSPLQERKNV